MAKVWFVKPETVRLDLSDGQWIEVKKMLTIGEQKRLSTSAFSHMTQTDENQPAKFDVDFSRYSLARAAAYIVDWSLPDAQGKTMLYTPEAIDALTKDAFEEIENAITKHIEGLEQEKKPKGGSTKSSMKLA